MLTEYYANKCVPNSTTNWIVKKSIDRMIHTVCSGIWKFLLCTCAVISYGSRAWESHERHT